MHYSHVMAIVMRQYYLMRGSIARLLPLFAWVAVDILLWGFITQYLNSIAAAKYNFVSLLLGAVLMWDFFTRIMQGVTTTFLEDVWSRNFVNLFATPLTIIEYISGLTLTSIVTSLIGLVVMLVLAITVFGLSFFKFGMMLIPFLLILFIFGIGLGIVGSAIVLRLGPASEWFIWPIPAMLSPFVGVFYPMSTLPKWMQVVGYLLPPSYVFEGMRALVHGEILRFSDLLWGMGLAVLYILLAGWYFKRVFHFAVRTGLLARYSAEGMN